MRTDNRGTNGTHRSQSDDLFRLVHRLQCAIFIMRANVLCAGNALQHAVNGSDKVIRENEGSEAKTEFRNAIDMAWALIGFNYALYLCVRRNHHAIALYHRVESFQVETGARCSRRGMQR